MGLIQRLVALHKADQDPLKTKESFTTMHNYEGRKQEHDALLREYGFPSEQDEAAMRYQRFSEEDSDPDSPDGVTHNRPPRLVNEASEMVAEINDEDKPSFKDSDKAKNRAGEKTASVSKGLIGRLVKLYKTGGGVNPPFPGSADSAGANPDYQRQFENRPRWNEEVGGIQQPSDVEIPDEEANGKMELMSGSTASKMKRQNKRGVTSGAQRMRGW